MSKRNKDTFLLLGAGVLIGFIIIPAIIGDNHEDCTDHPECGVVDVHRPEPAEPSAGVTVEDVEWATARATLAEPDRHEVDLRDDDPDYVEYERQLRQAIEEGWEWDNVALKATHLIDEALPLIAVMETGHNSPVTDHVLNAEEDALGRYQIRPIAVAEANRILKSNAFTLQDRTDPVKATKIARTYLAYWLPRRFGEEFQMQHIPILWKGGTNPESWGADTEEYARRFMLLYIDSQNQ